MRQLFHWCRKEFLHVFPVFVFFLISFFLINLTEEFLFRKAGISPFTFLNLVVAAGLIAKILLVIDHLPWIDRYKKRPLMYGIVWKTGIYWLILLGVRLSIRLFPYLLLGKGAKIDVETFVSHFNWRLFISIQAWYLMLLFIYVTGRELTQVLGASQMRRLFFGK